MSHSHPPFSLSPSYLFVSLGVILPVLLRHAVDLAGGMAGARHGRVSRSPSPIGLRAPAPTSSFEASSLAATEDQTDPFGCYSDTSCLMCFFYKSHCWGTTGAARWSNPVVRRPAPTPATSGSASRDSTARWAGSGGGGDSDNGGNRSSSDKSGRVSPVRSHCPFPLGFQIE